MGSYFRVFGVFCGSMAFGFLLPCVPCILWFHGFWVLTSVYSGVPVSLAVLVSCKVLTIVSARSTPAEVVPARTTDFQSVGQVVQPVRRTSSPSGKSYRWINRRDGLEVRRTRQSKRKRAAAPHATAFLRVQTSDSNKDSIEIKIPEAGQRPEARGNSQTAYHARWYVPRSIGCLLFDLTSRLNCLCNA